MQIWIHTMYLMARALVLSPKRDSLYLGFICRRWVETLTMTPFSATLSWKWALLRPLSSLILETSYIGFFASHFCGCEA